MYNRVHNVNTPEEIDLELLRQLESEPRLNQRGLAARLGLSLGKANYCLNALVRKGLIKISNFKRSDNKLAYAYLLTPSGLQEKTRLTIAFLKQKQQEYEQLQAEIAQLQIEVATLEREHRAADSSDVTRDHA
jgi:EPS-associated MarR family transcriptional regulator